MGLYRLIKGRSGEDEAARFLKARGFKILRRNYRCRFGEIDLVAADGETVVFVEVKTRSGSSFAEAAEAVNRKKMEHMTRASEFFLSEFGLLDHAARFDVVCIVKGERGTEIEHIQNAFEAP